MEQLRVKNPDGSISFPTREPSETASLHETCIIELRAQVGALEHSITELQAEVSRIRDRLGLNSANIRRHALTPERLQAALSALSDAIASGEVSCSPDHAEPASFLYNYLMKDTGHE